MWYLLDSISAVLNVLVLFLVVALAFSVVGIQIFKGKLYSCNDPTIHKKEDCVGFFYSSSGYEDFGNSGDGLYVPRVWQISKMGNFDNIFAAMLVVMQMTGLKWVDTMKNAINVTEVGQQPSLDASFSLAYFFVAYICIGTIFLVNLLLGVLIQQFRHNDGTAFLTTDQKRWMELAFMMRGFPLRAIRAPPATAVIRSNCFAIYRHRYFKRFSIIWTTLSVIIMCLSYREADHSYASLLKDLDFFFLSCYFVEVLVHSLALGRGYFQDSKNLFDFVMMLGGVTFGPWSYEDPGTAIRTSLPWQWNRLFRMGRYMRLIPRIPPLMQVIRTVRIAFPSIYSLVVLIFLVHFLYACIGRVIFGSTKFGYFLNDNSNFSTIAKALLLMFQLTSNDEWHLIMRDSMVRPPYCTVNGDCGSVVGSAVFFSSFHLLSNILLLNVFVALIIESFTAVCVKTEITITEEDLEDFRDNFARFDSENKGAFALHKLPAFLRSLNSPLRLDPRKERIPYLYIRSYIQRDFSAAQNGEEKAYKLLLRLLCIHRMGIKSLPYTEQKEEAEISLLLCKEAAKDIVRALARGWRERTRWRHREGRDRKPKEGTLAEEGEMRKREVTIMEMTGPKVEETDTP